MGERKPYFLIKRKKNFEAEEVRRTDEFERMNEISF
jgi:hypothetical protein